jgi:hypothetical protein
VGSAAARRAVKPAVYSPSAVRLRTSDKRNAERFRCDRRTSTAMRGGGAVRRLCWSASPLYLADPDAAAEYMAGMTGNFSFRRVRRCSPVSLASVRQIGSSRRNGNRARRRPVPAAGAGSGRGSRTHSCRRLVLPSSSRESVRTNPCSQEEGKATAAACAACVIPLLLLHCQIKLYASQALPTDELLRPSALVVVVLSHRASSSTRPSPSAACVIPLLLLYCQIRLYAT